MTEDELLELLAERQWQRMTRSTTPYADLTDSDQRACRVIVAPILADLRDLATCPHPRCIVLRGHQGGHVVADQPLQRHLCPTYVPSPEPS